MAPFRLRVTCSAAPQLLAVLRRLLGKHWAMEETRVFILGFSLCDALARSLVASSFPRVLVLAGVSCYEGFLVASPLR